MTPGFKPFGGVSLLVILVVTHPVNVAGNGHVDSTACQSSGNFPLFLTETSANEASPVNASHQMGDYFMPNGLNMTDGSMFHGGYDGDAPNCTDLAAGHHPNGTLCQDNKNFPMYLTEEEAIAASAADPKAAHQMGNYWMPNGLADRHHGDYEGDARECASLGGGSPTSDHGHEHMEDEAWMVACQSSGNFPLFLMETSANEASPVNASHQMGDYFMPNGLNMTDGSMFHGGYDGDAPNCTTLSMSMPPAANNTITPSSPPTTTSAGSSLGFQWLAAFYGATTIALVLQA